MTEFERSIEVKKIVDNSIDQIITILISQEEPVRNLCPKDAPEYEIRKVLWITQHRVLGYLLAKFYDLSPLSEKPKPAFDPNLQNQEDAEGDKG